MPLVPYVLPLLVVLWLTTISVAPVLARAWSYHYEPIAPAPSPASRANEASVMQGKSTPAEQLSKALLIKRTILSDLALLIQEQGARSNKAYPDRSEEVARQLLSFDQLSSPEALGVFAGLSGYYLGAPGEQLYDCLSLRKGKPLESYLEQYIHNGNAECSRELGPKFMKPSIALGGYALCRSDQQQKVHLTTLIEKIDLAKLCSDSNLAAVTAGPRPFPGEKR